MIKRAVIEIEGGCDYQCKMCPQRNGRGSFDVPMSFTDYCRVLDECIDMGLCVVQLDGSGEATLCDDLPKYIEYASNKGIKVQIYSNGFRMRDQFMKDCVDAGLSLFRFSVIGYNQEKYLEYTGVDNFDTVLQNIKSMMEYIDEVKSDCVVSSYHLILDDVIEVELYKQNIIDKMGCKSEIWKMHNWSGSVDINVRQGEKRSCGRPFAPEITIRAGGINGHKLAVTPCCQTSGRDEIAVLGHCDSNTVKECYNSPLYNWLRRMHEEKRFDEIDICKDCDFLYDDPTVLVWTNYVEEFVMNGLDFKLI